MQHLKQGLADVEGVAEELLTAKHQVDWKRVLFVDMFVDIVISSCRYAGRNCNFYHRVLSPWNCSTTICKSNTCCGIAGLVQYALKHKRNGPICTVPTRPQGKSTNSIPLYRTQQRITAYAKHQIVYTLIEKVTLDIILLQQLRYTGFHRVP